MWRAALNLVAKILIHRYLFVADDWQKSRLYRERREKGICDRERRRKKNPVKSLQTSRVYFLGAWRYHEAKLSFSSKNWHKPFVSSSEFQTRQLIQSLSKTHEHDFRQFIREFIQTEPLTEIMDLLRPMVFCCSLESSVCDVRGRHQLQVIWCLLRVCSWGNVAEKQILGLIVVQKHCNSEWLLTILVFCDGYDRLQLFLCAVWVKVWSTKRLFIVVCRVFTSIFERKVSLSSFMKKSWLVFLLASFQITMPLETNIWTWLQHFNKTKNWSDAALKTVLFEL